MAFASAFVLATGSVSLSSLIPRHPPPHSRAGIGLRPFFFILDSLRSARYIMSEAAGNLSLAGLAKEGRIAEVHPLSAERRDPQHRGLLQSAAGRGLRLRGQETPLRAQGSARGYRLLRTGRDGPHRC